jgi:hypothetical protein
VDAEVMGDFSHVRRSMLHGVSCLEILLIASHGDDALVLLSRLHEQIPRDQRCSYGRPYRVTWRIYFKTSSFVTLIVECFFHTIYDVCSCVTAMNAHTHTHIKPIERRNMLHGSGRKKAKTSEAKLCDNHWRFLRQSPRRMPAPSIDTPLFQRLQRQYTELDECDLINPTQRRVVLKGNESPRDDMIGSLMVEFNRLKTEKEKNALQAKERKNPSILEVIPHLALSSSVHRANTLPSSEHHKNAPILEKVEVSPRRPKEINMCKNNKGGRRKVSVHNPEDLEAARNSTKARIQERLDSLHQNPIYSHVDKEQSNGMTSAAAEARVTTPNIIWRTTGRVRIATDIPASLLGHTIEEPAKKTPTSDWRHCYHENETVTRPKKATYGAWYIPSKDWFKTSDKGHETNEDVSARSLHEHVPKLFIAREYRNFILQGGNGSMPAYLEDDE